MRISDWSSDVCSSDLRNRLQPHRLHAEDRPEPLAGAEHELRHRRPRTLHPGLNAMTHPLNIPDVSNLAAERSEEHTSELQSLMRISYAVFCLKTKKYNYNSTYTANKTHMSMDRLN